MATTVAIHPVVTDPHLQHRGDTSEQKNQVAVYLLKQITHGDTLIINNWPLYLYVHHIVSTTPMTRFLKIAPAFSETPISFQTTPVRGIFLGYTIR
jgi:hypothetical protein